MAKQVDEFDVVGTDAHKELVEQRGRLEAYEEMSFDELMAQGAIEVAEIDDVAQVDKKDLVGTEMIIFDWTFKSSDMGEYVIVKAKTRKGTVVFADGSTGVLAQLNKYQLRLEKAKESGESFAGLLVPHGLRRSDYQTEDADGNKINATTYYIDNRRS